MVSSLVLKFPLSFTEPLKITFGLPDLNPLQQQYWWLRLKFTLYWIHGLELPWHRSLLPVWPQSSVGLASFLPPWGNQLTILQSRPAKRVNHCCWSSQNWINPPSVHLLCHMATHIFPFWVHEVLNKQEKSNSHIFKNIELLRWTFLFDFEMALTFLCPTAPRFPWRNKIKHNHQQENK